MAASVPDSSVDDYAGAAHVDTGADSMLPITMASVTAFMQQMSFFYVYPMIATHQYLMCEVSTPIPFSLIPFPFGC